MRRTWGLVLAAAGLVSLASAGELRAQTSAVSGVLAGPREPVVARGAVVEIMLEDVSRADAVPPPLARVLLDAPLRWPLTFSLSYDSSTIHSGRRYAVRARVVEGDRTVLASAGTSLVLTQGHGATVTVPLVVVPAPPVVAETPGGPEPLTASVDPEPVAVSLPPPVAVALPVPTGSPVPSTLADLPATFTGVLPCDGCAGLRYHLNLFPDDTYALRVTPLGGSTESADEVGSWALSSDRRAVALDRPDGEVTLFSLNDAMSLRLLDASGQAVREPRTVDLRRSSVFQPVEVRVTARGVWRSVYGVSQFTECSTGQTWLLAGESVDSQLASAAAARGRLAGEALTATISGSLRRGAPAATGLSHTFTVAAVAVQADAGCNPRFAVPSLVRTAWRLTELGGVTQAVGVPAGLVLEADTRQFSGAEAGGCVRLLGSYDVADGAIAFLPAGELTVSACADPSGADGRTLADALRGARTYRIVGRTLELFDADRVRLARFEGS